MLDNSITNKESKNAKIVVIKNTNLLVIIYELTTLVYIIQNAYRTRVLTHHYFHITTLAAKRDAEATKRFLRKVLNAVYTQEFRVINVDKNAAYPKTVDELKEKEELSKQVELRQNKYLNNIVEQDHRGIKRLVKPGMRFRTFNTARRTLRGYEMMNMIRKGQIKGVAKGAVTDRVKFIAKIFGVVA